MSMLDEMLKRTRADVRERGTQPALAELQARCRDMPPTRDFVGAIRRAPATPGRRQGRVRIIAEVKKASPSRGVIRPDFDPVALARVYGESGADAISVLTDAPFFQGSLAHLAAVRRTVGLPVLRKDFHIDPYQVWEARAAGADAVLLIVAALSSGQLDELLGLAGELGLSALVEVHTEADVDTALACGARLVGINNRDLHSFTVSLKTTLALLPSLPAHAVVVSESGISETVEVARLADAGVDGILVGEGLLRHSDVGLALRRLTGAA